MKVEQTARGFPLTDAIRQHVRRRVRFALGRFETRIPRVIVRLADVNGPRGGVDKQCRVRVVLDGHGAVVVSELADDMYTSIDLACGRVGRVVGREMRRLRERRWSVMPQGGDVADESDGGMRLGIDRAQGG